MAYHGNAPGYFKFNVTDDTEFLTDIADVWTTVRFDAFLTKLTEKHTGETLLVKKNEIDLSNGLNLVTDTILATKKGGIELDDCIDLVGGRLNAGPDDEMIFNIDAGIEHDVGAEHDVDAEHDVGADGSSESTETESVTRLYDIGDLAERTRAARDMPLPVVSEEEAKWYRSAFAADRAVTLKCLQSRRDGRESVSRSFNLRRDFLTHHSSLYANLLKNEQCAESKTGVIECTADYDALKHILLILHNPGLYFKSSLSSVRLLRQDRLRRVLDTANMLGFEEVPVVIESNLSMMITFYKRAFGLFQDLFRAKHDRFADYVRVTQPSREVERQKARLVKEFRNRTNSSNKFEIISPVDLVLCCSDFGLHKLIRPLLDGMEMSSFLMSDPQRLYYLIGSGRINGKTSAEFLRYIVDFKAKESAPSNPDTILASIMRNYR